MNATESRTEMLSQPAKKPWHKSVMGKIAVIVILTLGLLIPLSMIGGVISERQGRKDEVINEIADTWGGNQALTGPVLVLPFKVTHSVVDSNGEKKNQVSTEFAYLLPGQYRIEANLKSETRYRSIYKSVVYTSDLKGDGEFDLSDLQQLKIPNQSVVWSDAFLVVNVPQPKSLLAPPSLQWDGKAVAVFPGTNGATLFNTGFYAPIACNEESRRVPFSLRVILRGMSSISLAPIGKQNRLEIKADWPVPSFSGSISPSSRTISDTGFTAIWEIPYFARNYPQAIHGNDNDKKAIEDSRVGVTLYVPIDSYRQSDRAVKYGILFLTLTFTVYFLFEIVGKFRLHPFQYFLVGCALCLFYLLLIAFSEVIGFTSSYALASLAIISSITLYSQAILGKTRRHSQWLIAALLTVLYVFLYILLRLEDLSLLFGAIGLFLALAIIMYVTRNVDWDSGQPEQTVLGKQDGGNEAKS